MRFDDDARLFGLQEALGEVPGARGYRFQGRTYHTACARKLEFGRGPWTWTELRDPDMVPQPILAGEGEPGLVCAACGESIDDPPRDRDGAASPETKP